MIAYLETNFVLVLALGQEGADDARELVDAAAASEIELAIPVFSLCEAYGTVTGRARQNRQSFRQMDDRLRELERNPVHQVLIDGLRAMLPHFLDVERNEMDGLETVVGELLACASVLALTPGIHAVAAQHQTQHDLAPADAMIYATVTVDAAERGHGTEKFFVTRNSKDFGTSPIRDELDGLGCRLLFDFRAARQRIGR